MAQELKAETIVPQGSTITLQMYPKAEVDAVLAEKDAEIRRLQRALWIASANSTEGQIFYWCTRFGVENGFTKADIRGYSVNTKRIMRTIREWFGVWQNVERKCRAKAEEY